MKISTDTIWIIVAIILIVCASVSYFRIREGFQSTAVDTKPAWLDPSRWTPLLRTRFGWTGLTPSAWFQYDYVSMTSLEPIYDTDLAAAALSDTGNDPIKAREKLKSNFMDYIKRANKAGTSPQEVTPYTGKNDVTDDSTRPSGVYSTMWTPLHRVMWGIKNNRFDSIEHDLVVRAGAPITTNDLQGIVQASTQRTFPATIAERALEVYGQDVQVARQKLLNGTAFETGLSAYNDMSGTLFNQYGIFLGQSPADLLQQWTPINRTMYPLALQGTPFEQTTTDSAGKTTKTTVRKYIFKRDDANKIIPQDIAQYMLSITGDDPVEARYLYFQNPYIYKLKYEQNKIRSKDDSVANIKERGCAELNSVYINLNKQIVSLRPLIQDLSGSSLVAAGAKSENMRFQKRFYQDCSGTTSDTPGSCYDLATQDDNLFSVHAEYEATNLDLFSREIEVKESLKTVKDTMKLLKCSEIPSVEYSVEKDIGYIDTTDLFMKLSELSPYYVSPDVIRKLSEIMLSDSDAGDLAVLEDTIKMIDKRKDIIVGMLQKYRKV